MNKTQTAIIKEMNRKNKVYFTTVKVEADTLKHHAGDTTIELRNIGLKDGYYSLSDLAKGKKLNLKSFNSSDFQEGTFQPGEETERFTTKNDFKSYLKMTSKDELKVVLTGVFINSEGKTVTDSVMMKYSTKDSNGDVLNNYFCKLLSIVPDEELLLCFSDKCSIFENRGIKITSKLIDGKYPHFQHIIPEKGEHDFIFSDKDLKHLKQLKKFGYKNIVFREKEVYIIDGLVSGTTDKLITKLDIETNLNFCLNLEKLITVLEESDSMCCNTKDQTRPIKVGDNGLIVPMELNNELNDYIHYNQDSINELEL